MSRVIVCHLMNLAESIGHIDSALASQLKDVMRDLENPFLYNDVFPVSLDSQAKPEDERDDDVEQAVAEDTRAPDYLQQLQEKSPAAVILFAEMLQKVYDGQYDEGIVVLSEASRPEDLLTAGASELKQLGMDLKELAKASAVSSSVLGVGTSSQAPKPSLRELVRRTSEGGDPEAAAVERQDIWKRSIAQRKKLASLYQAKHPKNAESYREAFEKFPEAVRDFKGKPGQEHRVFVLSCDLLNSKGPTPWLVPSPPEDKMLEAVLAFLGDYGRGNSDVIMVWDGCQRKTRRTLEDKIGSMSSTAEVFIIYTLSWNAWIKKKYLLGSENKECGYIRFPVQRTKQGVKKRAAGNAAGEESSHWTTITGVEPLSRLSLPRISPEDKLRIFPEAPSVLPSKWCKKVRSGVPMFWGETKSVQTWDILLDEVSAKCVVDLSPGAGTLASTCLSKSIPYHGIVGNAAHLGWLTNVLDRSSLQYLSRAGHTLYQEDLATHVKELFGELLETEAAANDDEICITESETEQQ